MPVATETAQPRFIKTYAENQPWPQMSPEAAMAKAIFGYKEGNEPATLTHLGARFHPLGAVVKPAGPALHQELPKVTILDTPAPGKLYKPGDVVSFVGRPRFEGNNLTLSSVTPAGYEAESFSIGEIGEADKKLLTYLGRLDMPFGALVQVQEGGGTINNRWQREIPAALYPELLLAPKNPSQAQIDQMPPGTRVFLHGTVENIRPEETFFKGTKYEKTHYNRYEPTYVLATEYGDVVSFKVDGYYQSGQDSLWFVTEEDQPVSIGDEIAVATHVEPNLNNSYSNILHAWSNRPVLLESLEAQYHR